MRRVLSVLSFLLLTAGFAAAQNAAGPGRVDLPMIAGQHHDAGTVIIHNNNGGLLIDVRLANDWYMVELHVHAGWAENPIPVTKDGNPKPGKFEFKYEYDVPTANQPVYLDFDEDLQGFRWGEPWEEQRLRHIAVHAEVVRLDSFGNVVDEQGAWAQGSQEFAGASQWCWWELYAMAHKQRTHFIDSPVGGLLMVSPTEFVLTDQSGSAAYFPGEVGTFYLGNQLLGTTLLEHKVSPLDLFPVSDVDDPRVINMAVLLQSLDADADPKPGISITPEVAACFNQALASWGPVTDWADSVHVDLLVDATIQNCTGIAPLVKVLPEDAQANLDRSVNSHMFRKNVSRTPERVSSKAKLNVMGVWFPAVKANGEPSPVEYYDDEGELIRTATEAKPIIVSYTDAADNGSHDVWGAVSRDDGHTWKKKNLSRMAERSSYTRLDGYEYPGECRKPVQQVKGNKILVAWTSKYARGGRPRYSINVCPPDEPDCIVCTGYGDNMDCGPDYVYDDPYYADDIWGVSGPQRSHDYTEDGYPEVGEVPYSAVWVARGVIVTPSMIGSSSFWANYDEGDIVWFKPERLTSGRRDAYQVFMGGADDAGFAITWQEDPGGLRPGDGSGPGHGWGGATTNHKTDIWYSYITWDDFAKVDMNFEAGGDPQHADPDFVGRPKALVPMSLPVRISDNDVVNTHNMWIQLDDNDLPVLDGNGDVIPLPNPDTNSGEGDGSHRYGYMVEGLWDWDRQLFFEDQPVDWQHGNGGTLFRFTNHQGDQKTAVVTADGRALRGNTGASRPNLFLQAYTNNNGTPSDPSDDFKSAWAIMAYEETKGVGLGPDGRPDRDGGEHEEDGTGYDPNVVPPDEGKNVIYHSFDFRNPDVVSAGTILNLPETDAVTG
ncbi:MAG: choice-of-anchor O protein, partial [Candidatus Sulfomarinibacteraceae bacterium]